MCVELKWKSKWFTQENVENLKDGDGIYLICKENDTGTATAVYVGQGDIKSRLSLHLSKNDTNTELYKFICNNTGNLFVCYSYVGKNKLDGIEKFLFNTYKPKFNKISPPGDEIIKVNLP